MGETAENLVDKFGISREDQDAFAFHSQQKAAQSQASGRLAREIAPLIIPQKKGDALVFEKDEFIKPKTSLEGLAALKPAFRPKGGTVTAGNASGLNDGSAALLLASENGIKQNNLRPLARIVSAAVVGVEPRIMGIGPVEASKKALSRAGLTIDELDLIEINEAFAAQALACLRELKIADQDPRINVNGGAIALGHPLGMSGTRIAFSAALELHLTGKKFALVTMCIGVGQGYAVVLEKA
jgi:acetyl-CoA acetyltransferase family protein